MKEFLEKLFSSNFMPHGHCYLWNPGLIWLHVISDSLIALAYFSIPVTLIYFIHRRRDLPFHWVFVCFGMFILACGATHTMEVWTLWHANYWLAGAIKAVTAMASVPTAILLFQSVPPALALPSPESLRVEIAERKRTEQALHETKDELEFKVLERTAELRKANEDLVAEIAQRKQADEALRKAQKELRQTIDAIPQQVFVFGTDWSPLFANQRGLEYTGLTPQEAHSKDAVAKILHPEDFKKLESLRERMGSEGIPFEMEARIRGKNGQYRWFLIRDNPLRDEQGGVIRWYGTRTDIEERKQAQELFQLATEASPSGIILVSDQGRVVLVNSHIEKLFGYRRDELIGKPVEILVPERLATQHPAYRASFFAAPEARAMGAGRELFARRKDGSEFPVEIGLNPIQMPQGLLILANVVDISARKAAEEEARRRREQVELLGRVSLLGEMTASLAHELNQPLTAIVNNATAAMQYIEQGRLDPQQLQDILTDVVGDARRAYDIMRNVRSAIKKGSAIRGRINLNDVVKAVTHMVHPDAAAHFCKVEMSLARNLPAIEGDPIQIQQVLINLVHNAFDAMRDTPPSRRKVEIATNYNGDGTICVAVRDYGSGIPEPTQERLFEQFFTTKEEGLGMGLAIVRSIVEAHGGSIAAENADGGGARFRFRLPTKEGMPQ